MMTRVPIVSVLIKLLALINMKTLRNIKIDKFSVVVTFGDALKRGSGNADDEQLPKKHSRCKC